jgi:hypothetical protein
MPNIPKFLNMYSGYPRSAIGQSNCSNIGKNFHGRFGEGCDLRVKGFHSAIDTRGDMVGLSTPSANGFDETATVYFAGSTTPVDMNTLIDPIPDVHLVRGIDINNLGQILVEADIPQGYRYYVLTPVPEPAMLATLSLAALRVRRRRGG